MGALETNTVVHPVIGLWQSADRPYEIMNIGGTEIFISDPVTRLNLSQVIQVQMNSAVQYTQKKPAQ
jgi:hypothetical protein